MSDEQARLWNGPSGHAWVENQELLDHLYKPFEDLLVAEASRKPRRAVLDVGCGAGATTIAIARRLNGTDDGAAEAAPSVRDVPTCVGVDISEPLVAAARARSERERTPATFICDNAQTCAFEPATFDLIVSRFGIMFFDDPVAAFANLRRATREDGELRVIPWRSAAENPFMTTAERSAAALAAPAAAAAERAWAVRAGRRPPHARDSRRERMARHRRPSDRRGLHDVDARPDAPRDAARAGRTGAAGRR